ncbi:MAG: rRNA maturation RNase YbeY [Chitinophagaceae bacterium]|nr:rRNA maturation RNase YbeY [Chitinophagaceae bacterium]
MQSKKIFYFHSRKLPSIGSKAKLTQHLLDIFKAERIELESLSIILISDQELIKINKQYLKHDYYTDILTFELNGENAPVWAEIYISLDRVKENAKTFKIFYRDELLRVIIHGILHLCGYKDGITAQKNKMSKLETKYLYKYVSRETS